MFIKRLGYFMVGLSIGLVFLTFFLKKKSDETGVSFCYLPNCRVLKDLRSKPIYYADAISKRLESKELDTVLLHSFFVDGDVNFGASDTEAKTCKTYLIEKEIEGVLTILTVRNCTKKAVITALKP